MATAYVTLVAGTWTAITAAGKAGTAWLVSGQIAYVDHSTTGTGTLDRLKSKPCFKPNSNLDALTLKIDSAGDIFYAIPAEASATIIAVDVL